ncbi:MAG: glutamine synthetase family protein [Clostridia bacterium]|nr:glutamine synthetase family protein [Clostridia bacterium]
MKYSINEVKQFVKEEDVKFIRLAFCDIYGKQKNISIMPGELDRAFNYGIAFDASAVDGFGGDVHSDLMLRPDPSTLSVLPWRPEHGRVVRMFCDVLYPDGTQFECDVRSMLRKAEDMAKKDGISFVFGNEMEFYLFKTDDDGKALNEPYDNAGYMDIAPEDKGENVRREICLTLEQMGIIPESSHHEEGPGQNEIDFRYSSPLTAADDAVTFKAAVKTVAARNGLYADFSPKPLEGKPGSGMHINISVKGRDENLLPYVLSGMLDRISEMTVFLNPSEQSFKRFGSQKAPLYITWSSENRSQLIRIPAAFGEYTRAELRSPDPGANPYIAYTLLIYAGLMGIKEHKELPPPADINLYSASAEQLKRYHTLPRSLSEARQKALKSEFISKYLPQTLINSYCGLY